MFEYNFKRYIRTRTSSRIQESKYIFFYKSDYKKYTIGLDEIDGIKKCIEIIKPSIVIVYNVYNDNSKLMDIMNECSVKWCIQTREGAGESDSASVVDLKMETKRENKGCKSILLIHPELYGPCDMFFTKCNNKITNLISEYYQRTSICRVNNKKRCGMYMYSVDLVRIIYMMIQRVQDLRMTIDNVYYITTQEISEDNIRDTILNGVVIKDDKTIVKTNRDKSTKVCRFNKQFPTFEFTNLNYGILETKMYIDVNLVQSPVLKFTELEYFVK
jgi:hypothetical protein